MKIKHQHAFIKPEMVCHLEYEEVTPEQRAKEILPRIAVIALITLVGLYTIPQIMAVIIGAAAGIAVAHWVMKAFI